MRGDLEIVVNRDHMLRHLHLLGPLTKVVLDGPFTAEQLDRHLPRTALDRLVITDNPALGDPSLLRGRPRIRHLHVESTVRIRDVPDAAGSRPTTLTLDAALLLAEDLEVIPAVDGLRELHLHRLPIGPYAWLLPPHPSVARLSVPSQDLRVDTLHHWVGLRALAVRQPAPLDELFTQLAALPGLRALQLSLTEPAEELRGLPALSRGHSLTLPDLVDDPPLDGVAATFAALHRLTVGFGGAPPPWWSTSRPCTPCPTSA